MKTLCLLFAVLATLANAQVPASAPPFTSACYTLSYTKNLKGDYKKLLKAKCEKEIREAKQLAPIPVIAPIPVVPGSIGVASRNVAVTTVTNRTVDTNGKTTAMEGSSGWAKLELAKIDAEKKIAVEEAKSSRPAGCGWLGCYTPVVGYGYYGGGYTGGYYYGGGQSYGTNRVYGTGGGGHGRRH
jgi:hypothetical protein